MTKADQQRVPPVPVTLKDNRTVIIRPLQCSDAYALGVFYEAVPREDYRFYCPHPLNCDTAREVAARADEPLSICLVAVEGDAIVGYTSCNWNDTEAPKCSFGLCVARAFQGAGLGRALMAHILDICATVGPPLVCLTVQQANPRAVALYRSMGFAVVREQIRKPVDEFPSEPEYYMERALR